MPEFDSSIILITGSTGGIGYATARFLLATGANVVVHGPTPAGVQLAAQRLVAAGLDSSRLDVVAADFSRLDEVANMAQQLLSRYDRIDVLVNNAAIVGPPSRHVTEDGYELTFQVNFLAAFLLTSLLMPVLRAAGGRMVAVSSALHRTANINWSGPERHRFYTPVSAYAQSKLALSMFARATALQPAGVAACSVHPGIVETDLMHVYGSLGDPVDSGAAAVARLCSPSVELLGGTYYDGLSPAAPAPLVDNDAAVTRLWKLTARLLDERGYTKTIAA